MPDEIMKCFLEQIIECFDGIADALTLILQHYHVNTTEKDFLAELKQTTTDEKGDKNYGEKK